MVVGACTASLAPIIELNPPTCSPARTRCTGDERRCAGAGPKTRPCHRRRMGHVRAIARRRPDPPAGAVLLLAQPAAESTPIASRRARCRDPPGRCLGRLAIYRCPARPGPITEGPAGAMAGAKILRLADTSGNRRWPSKRCGAIDEVLPIERDIQNVCRSRRKRAERSARKDQAAHRRA